MHVPRGMMLALAPLALRLRLSHCFYVFVELALDKVDCQNQVDEYN